MAEGSERATKRASDSFPISPETMQTSFYTSESFPNIERDWSKMFTAPRSISSILARFDDYFNKYPWYRGSMVQGINLYDDCVFYMRDNCPGADNILEATHIINGKEASIKRILYVCNIPKTATAEELISTFSEFGKVEECDYGLRFTCLKPGRLFAIIAFDSEKVVDELAARGKIEFRGEHLEVKKVELGIIQDVTEGIMKDVTQDATQGIMKDVTQGGARPSPWDVYRQLGLM